jgi:UDP-glucuronate 4-epimerase
VDNPHIVTENNILGFLNVLEMAKQFEIKHLVYASSSSVYGLNKKMPFSPQDSASHPTSLYGATKKSNELMAHAYSHLFEIPTTGLRFFTVYGPWGRPDMAAYKFIKAVDDGLPIELYAPEQMMRDFTFVDDVISAMVVILKNPPKPADHERSEKFSEDTSTAPYRIYNVGRGAPIRLIDFVNEIELFFGREVEKKILDYRPEDLLQTWADTTSLQADFQIAITTSLRQGIRKTAEWYLANKKIKTSTRPNQINEIALNV